jgi:hypothetical protein
MDHANSNFQDIAFSRGGTAAERVGFLYCIANPAMPGLVKIGYTNRTTEIRIHELSFGTESAPASGVPAPFYLVKEWRLPAGKSEEVEQAVHQKLDEHRYYLDGKRRWAKEFFFLEPDESVKLIEAALKELDWWCVVTAKAENLEKELAAKRERVAQAKREWAQYLERRKLLDHKRRDAIVEYELATAKKMDGVCKAHGYKWAGINGGGFAIFLLILGAKVGAFSFAGIFAAISYYMSRDTPYLEYLKGEQGKKEKADVVAQVPPEQKNAPLGAFFLWNKTLRCPLRATP